MFRPTYSDYYRNQLESLKQSILSESDEQILGSDIDVLANYFFQQYALISLEFNPSDITYEIRKEIRRIPASERDSFYQSQGDLDFEFEKVNISIPISKNPNLDWIKKLEGASITLDRFNEQISYSPLEIGYSFDTKWYRGSLSADNIINEINSKSARLISVLVDKNNNIKTENTVFLQGIKNIISERKNQLLADKEKINSLTREIKIPLKQKVSTENQRNITVDTKKFIRIVKPTPKLPEEYTLEEAILHDILNYVINQCKSFEKTPASYKQLGEEQLRDIILAALNGIFEGNATGETFVKKGKTDIYLKIEKGEILIFECKFWGGESIYLQTIEQLIGYVTWRQNYGIIIMFCKNKDFSKILSQIPDIIQKHDQYVGSYKIISSSHFSSQHTLPEDSGKIIKVHHLIFNLYSE